jgi:membrane-associated protease RseP (regulator of RpoE activity)
MTQRHPYLTFSLTVSVALALVALPPTRPFALTIGVLLALIAFHEAGHLWAARANGVGASEFSVGFGPLLAGTNPKPGRTRFVLRAIPLGGYVRIKGMSESGAATKDESVPGKAYGEVSPLRQVSIAAAGPAANLFLAAVVLVLSFGLIGAPAPTTTVTVDPSGPAYAAGLRDGDKILEVAGESTAAWADVTANLTGTSAATVPVTVARGGQTFTFNVAPADSGGGRRLGVVAGSEVRRLPPVEAAAVGANATWKIVAGSAAALAQIPQLVADIPAHIAGTAEDQNARFVSPVGMTALAEQSFARDGILGVAVLVALISVFLGLFNLLPVPPLDGGHIVIASYEGIASRVAGREMRVNRVAVSRVAMAFAVVLLVIGVSSIVLDIVRPVALP